jgi:hypothetical protein
MPGAAAVPSMDTAPDFERLVPLPSDLLWTGWTAG